MWVIVVPVEERQLLRAMGQIVGGVDVQNDDLRVGRQPIDPTLLEALQQSLEMAHLDRILESRQRWLRGQSLVIRTRTLADRLQQRIVAQTVGIVAVLVPQRDLIQPLAHLLAPSVHRLRRRALIGHLRCKPLAHAQLVVHLPQQNGPAIGGDLRRIKADLNRLLLVELQRDLCDTTCHRPLRHQPHVNLRQFLWLARLGPIS